MEEEVVVDVGIEPVEEDPTPGKSRLGGPTAALSERLYRVGLEPATVAALTSKVSLGDLRDYQHDAEFWQQLGEVLTTGGAPAKERRVTFCHLETMHD